MSRTIVHVLYEPSFMFGGVGTYARELANAQSKDDNVFIVYIDKYVKVEFKTNESEHKMISNSGYSFIKKIYDRTPKSIREFIKISKLRQNLNRVVEIVEDDSIIFHYHNSRVAKLLTYFKGKSKLVHTVHGYLAFELLSDNDVKEGSKKYNKLLNIEKFSYELPDINICVDKKIEDHVKGLTNKANTVWHANFVNENEFSICDADRKSELRDKYNIPADKSVFITTRRFEKKNGIPVFAEAISKLDRETIKKSLFLLVGNGSEFETVSSILQKSEADYQLCGAVPHSTIKDYYNLADSFVIPSISIKGVEEATSISTLEAMSCGNIVIASNIGGLKLLIQDNKNGFLIEDNNSDILADKIRIISRDLDNYNELRKNARKSIVDQYSLNGYKKFIDKYYE